MLTVKSLRESINNNSIDQFKLQEYVKFLAENIESIPLGTELAFKEYIRKAADSLGIEIEDLQAVYNSFRK